MGSAAKDVDALYADCNEVKNENQWSGTAKKEARAGVVDCYYNKGLQNERKVTVLEAKASVSDEENLGASRAEIKTLEFIDHNGDAELRVGAINAGLEGAIGENIGAFARAEVLSVGVNAGENFGARLGVAFDTGARLGKKGIEAKFLGTGFMVDPDKGIGISVFGTGINFKFW